MKAKENSGLNKVLDKVPALKGDSDRKSFVIKVYALIFIMLLVTSVWGFVVYKNINGTKDYVLSNLWIFYISIIIIIG